MGIILRGTLTQKIRKMLKRWVRLRDSDNKLIANLWALEYSQRLGRELNEHEEHFFHFMARGSLPSPESIRRTRQKLQEAEPELRGLRYEERQNKLERSVREEIRNA